MICLKLLCAVPVSLKGDACVFVGVIDLEKHASLGGSYTGIEPMGLFWAMKPSSKNKVVFENDLWIK